MYHDQTFIKCMLTSAKLVIRSPSQPVSDTFQLSD